MDILKDQKQQASLVRPEPGQLVEVRRRQWIVSDVQSSSLDPAHHFLGIKEVSAPYMADAKTGLSSDRQHLVSMSSIDEDGLGEELEVIWEIEPGAQVIERAGLPSITGQDDSDTLEAFLDAVRWGAATNADRGFLQAPFRSGVSIEDFQLDPLVRAIDMARVNLLIADDVGLGKTIEAGLVIQEMLLRHRARTVLIICPASLQEKWRVEMLEKFGLEFRVVDTAYIKQLRRERGIHANPWTSHPRLIASMDWVKSGEGLRAMRDVLPSHTSYPRKFDMLVVDEAHNIAPAAGANYALESQRTRFIRSISPHFQHRLFLTATPHNGYTESFTSLLELLDDQRFARNILPDEKQLSQVMIRRLKSDLVDAEGKPLYAQRKLQALLASYSPQERAIHQKLNDYCASREQDAEKVGNAFGTSFVNQLLKKRLFSSPAAFASTLEKHIASLANGGQRKNKDAMADRILRKAILRVEEDYADDQEVENAQSEAVEEASRRAQPLTAEQQQMLNELRSWAQTAKNQVDAKAKAVLDWLATNLKTEGQWNDRRVILFTEYRTTHQWMHEILASHGFGGERLAILHGGMPQDEREKVKAAFQTSPKDSAVRILLATDAASEGIDLQNHCNCLIHLEIPYNPNVMEQRNGRIDRHGQRQKEVLIWHPVDGGDRGKATIGGHGDDIIRALRKLESMRADMGSVNPVIAPQMSGLIEGSLKDLDTRLAEAKIAKARRFVRAERELKDRVAKLHERLLTTQQDFHLTPEHILMAVKTGLVLAGRPPLEPFPLADVPAGTVFTMPALSGSWARCLEGLRHPHTQQIRPITFDHAVATGRDDVVLVHLNHRLVQMCLRLLRAEVWAQDDVKKLHRVTVRSVPDALIDGPAVVVISRLVVTGGNHHRLHEELTVAGGYLGDKSFRREDGVTKVQQWLDQAKPIKAEESLFDAIRVRFDRAQSAILQTVDARSKDRLKFLTNTLQSRKQQEVEDINAVLDELEKAIQAELNKDQQPSQLSLFSEDERTQLRRDTAALEARLARIPAERQQEAEAIRNPLCQTQRPHLPSCCDLSGARIFCSGRCRMSYENHHDWLSLIEISGPFLAVPVLKEAFPQGLEELDASKRKRLRQAYEEWREALELEDAQFAELHVAWIDEVLSRGLELDEDGKGDVLKRADWCTVNLKANLPEHGVTLSPDLAVVDEQRANKPLLLIQTYAQHIDLDATLKQDGWAATPADRMVALCRSLGCRLGLVTNGERWMLVDAPVGAVTTFASWYARIWSQEPITLQAFVHLLGIRRFFVDESEQLPALFDRSLKFQDEVTDALGEQVRRAVEVLIQTLDKADQDRDRELLHDVKESELYEAALRVMMRLVFLLSAEERGLLLMGDERYEANYALSTLRMQLRKESEEILERRWDAWSRLLAIFRAVFGGIEHENLRLPALGGSLFDPDRFPFLEGRAKGSNWRTDAAKPLPIDNRTVLLLLEAIQQFQGRTLSYRALDVEQIGYVYEGLLERTVKRTDEVTLELDATKSAKTPWVKLAELDSARLDGAARLAELLQERSGSSTSRVRNDLAKPVDDTLADRLLTACLGDTKLRDRIKPYAHLLRTDPWGYPLVYPAGAFIVTTGSDRRETGTHYTPKSLTESIVTETLTPVAYVGPAEGTLRDQWKLKSPAELLDLKICDPAMGSGAFWCKPAAGCLIASLRRGHRSRLWAKP